MVVKVIGEGDRDASSHDKIGWVGVVMKVGVSARY